LTRIGLPVKVIESDIDNIKITTPGDLYMAEVMLRKLRKAGRVKL
jgi:2-C-methyl-D-erythritol 4-phosphate cytidylyltransferase